MYIHIVYVCVHIYVYMSTERVRRVQWNKCKMLTVDILVEGNMGVLVTVLLYLKLFQNINLLNLK